MLYLKLGTKADLNEVLNLAYDMHSNSVYSTFTEFNYSVARDNYLKSLSLAMDDACTIILMKDKAPIGFISCGIAPLYFSTERIATEAGFWIYKHDRTIEGLKKLLSAYYYWAREVGCIAALIGKIDKDNVESYRLKVFEKE